MRNHRQILNPRQPNQGSYRRESEQYFRDELQDVFEGGDYIPERRRPGSYRNVEDDRFYYPSDYYSQSEENWYVPSNNFGYAYDEYAYDRYDRGFDPRRDTIGYGEIGSNQNREFDRWRREENRRRSFRNDQFVHHNFERTGRPSGNFDYNDHENWSSRGRYRSDHFDRYHDRSDRHPVIVRPFKESYDYGRNDYNNSRGFGSNEMVFHEDYRDDRDTNDDWLYEHRSMRRYPRSR